MSVVTFFFCYMEMIKRGETMKRNLKRCITYIGLLFMLAMMFCGCSNGAEQEGTFTDVTGHPGVTEQGTERVPEEGETSDEIANETKPAEDAVDMKEEHVEENREDIEEECEEDVTPELTSTPMPTSTPTPVITDPYDGKFWTGKYAADKIGRAHV